MLTTTAKQLGVEAPTEASPFLIADKPSDLSILSVYPLLAPLAGTTIEITGTSFTQGCTVFIGNVQAETQVKDSETMSVRTPALEPGLYSVTVFNVDRSRRVMLENCLFYSGSF